MRYQLIINDYIEDTNNKSENLNFDLLDKNNIDQETTFVNDSLYNHVYNISFDFTCNAFILTRS